MEDGSPSNGLERRDVSSDSVTRGEGMDSTLALRDESETSKPEPIQ